MNSTLARRLASTLGSIALALSAPSVGCGISPIPEPPAGTAAAGGAGATGGCGGSAGLDGSAGTAGGATDAGSPSVDLQFVSANLPNDPGSKVQVVGAPGAAVPAGAIVRVYNLDSTEPPANATSNADGSFKLEVLGSYGDELRLQLLTDTDRRTPVDFVIPDFGHPTPSVRPLADCLLITPSTQMDASRVSALHVENRCAEQVQIQAPRVRRDVPGLQVQAGSDWPAIVPPSTSIDVPIVFHPSTDVDEEIVFIEAATPQVDRRPITVYGVSP